jgi:hypothetical protein
MATQTRPELQHVFDCNIDNAGLTEFEPEPERVVDQAPADPDQLRLHDEPFSDVDVLPAKPVVVPEESRRWPIIAATVIALAAVLGGAVSWFGMRARVTTLPAPPPAVATTIPDALEVPVKSAPALPAVQPAPALVRPAPTPAPVQPAPAVVRPTPTATATATESIPVSPAAERRTLDPALDRTLARVSDAYRRLDASALTSIWPGADTASLSRAFAGLKYQSLSFERCSLRPNGPTGALASCDVSLAMASNGGDAALQRRHESWTLVLDRTGDPWTIAGVSVH